MHLVVGDVYYKPTKVALLITTVIGDGKYTKILD